MAEQKKEEPKKESDTKAEKASGTKIKLTRMISYKGTRYGPGEVTVKDKDVAEHLESRDALLQEEENQATGLLHRGDGSISGISPVAQAGANQIDAETVIKNREEAQRNAQRKSEPKAGGVSGPDAGKK